jgi:N-methylhydantoinase A
MLEGRSRKVGLIQTRAFGNTLAISRGFKGIGLARRRSSASAR